MSDDKQYTLMPENRTRGLRRVAKKCGKNRIFVSAEKPSKQGNITARVVFVERVNASWSPVAAPTYAGIPNIEAAGT